MAETYNGLNQTILVFTNKNGQLVPVAGLQPGYGPHASLAAAQTAISGIFESIANVPQGYTFCVLENQKPVEYWFTRSGGWYVEKKCNGSSSSPSQVDLSNLAIRLDYATGELSYSTTGPSGMFITIGNVDPKGTIDKIQLKIDDETGHLYISYNGGANGTWRDVGMVAGETPVVQKTQIRFTTNGSLEVSYDNGVTWVPVDGNQYQGRKIDEIEFKRLLKKYLILRTFPDGFLKVSYDAGADNTWDAIAKSCTCTSEGTPSGDSDDTTPKLYRLTIDVRDYDTQQSITNGVSVTIGGKSGFVRWLEPGAYIVNVSCSGYTSTTETVVLGTDDVTYPIFLHANADVPKATIIIVPVEEDETTVIQASNIKVYVNNRLLGSSPYSYTVNSGDVVFIKVEGNSGSRYGTVEENVRVDVTDNNHKIVVPFAASVEENPWSYVAKRDSLQSSIIYNVGGRVVNDVFTAYRQHKVTGTKEALTLINLYNIDGDTRVTYTGPTPLPSDDINYTIGSQYATVTYPSAQKQYLHGGCQYKMAADFQDTDGNVVTAFWDAYYEGFWEYYIEKYNQIGYPDSNDGGDTTIRVDSYCIADSECPDATDRRFACPVEIIPKTGVTINSINTVYVNDGTVSHNYSNEYNTRQNGCDNYRNIISVSLTQDPSTISGNTVIDDNLCVPIEVAQDQTQHYPYYGTGPDQLITCSGYISENVMIETREYVLSFSEDSQNQQAPGKYSSRSENGHWNSSDGYSKYSQVVFTTYAKAAASSSSKSFVGCEIKVTDSSSNVIYKANMSNTGSLTILQTNYDGYLTRVGVGRGPESQASSRYKVYIEMHHTMNYMPTKVYVITVTQENQGKSVSTSWTLMQEVPSDRDGIYGHQALSTSAGTTYFGVYGNYSATDLGITNNGRSNLNEIVLTKVGTLPSDLTVNPMDRAGSSWYAQGNEPVRVPDPSAISWFKLDYPAITNDAEPERRQVQVYYDDGSPTAAVDTEHKVFFGQQGNTN